MRRSPQDPGLEGISRDRESRAASACLGTGGLGPADGKGDNRPASLDSASPRSGRLFPASSGN